MTLSTNGINIDNLPIKVTKIIPKSIDEYKKDIQETMSKIKEDGKRGVAIFRDNKTTNAFSKPSLKMDF